MKSQLRIVGLDQVAVRRALVNAGLRIESKPVPYMEDGEQKMGWTLVGQKITDHSGTKVGECRIMGGNGGGFMMEVDPLKVLPHVLTNLLTAIRAAQA